MSNNSRWGRICIDERGTQFFYEQSNPPIKNWVVLFYKSRQYRKHNEQSCPMMHARINSSYSFEQARRVLSGCRGRIGGKEYSLLETAITAEKRKISASLAP